MRSKPRSAGIGGPALLFLIAIAAGLLGWNGFTASRNARIAIGPPGSRQQALFQHLATRPDALVFFQRLSPSGRLAMARNLGAYHNPRLVPLVATLLETFDGEAREELTRVLERIAKLDPQAVSRELHGPSGHRRDAIFRALRAAGDPAVPYVVERLASPEHRAAASRLLVEIGARCERHVLKALDAPDEPMRLAAAEVLGKLRSVRAVPRLLELYADASKDARASLMGAIANVGDLRAEPTLREALQDEKAPTHLREQAAIGLGRVASREAILVLERLAAGNDLYLAVAAREGLRLAGDAALRELRVPSLRVGVAASVPSDAADRTLASALRDPAASRADLATALKACAGRAALIADVLKALRRLDSASDGDLIEAAIEALVRTPQASARIEELAADPDFEGWIARSRHRLRVQAQG